MAPGRHRRGFPHGRCAPHDRPSGDRLLQGAHRTDTESTRRLSDCVTALLREQPFFGSLALRLPLLPDPSRKTLASDGLNVRFNPDWITRTGPRDPPPPGRPPPSLGQIGIGSPSGVGRVATPARGRVELGFELDDPAGGSRGPGVNRQRMGRPEMQVPLDAEAEGQADGGNFKQA